MRNVILNNAIRRKRHLSGDPSELIKGTMQRKEEKTELQYKEASQL